MSSSRKGKSFNVDLLREILRMFEESNVARLEISTDDFKLKLSKYPDTSVQPLPVSPPAPQPVAAQGSTEEKPAERTEEEGVHYIKAPMVGTFYRAPAPGADPFVKVGDRVKKGDVVCIIEAMKIMNEIKSDVDGIVEEVLVENAHPVEYGQPLFKIRLT